MPVIFTLNTSAASAGDGLRRLWVRDGAEAAWPQRVLAQWGPDNGAAVHYAQTGGVAAELAGRTPTGVNVKGPGLAFAAGGSESFSIDVPPGSGIVLRKRYFLDKTGQSASVLVNGKAVGVWNLKRSETALSEGVREAVFVIDAASLANAPKANIELKYDAPANTIAWTALEYRGGDFPLSAMGPVHADQQVGPIRIGRNMIGGPLKVDVETFANGIGAYANSLLEYPLNGQFAKFAAKVGVDAATEGRGSVVFEVWGDGKKLWSSGIMSGLDRAKSIDVNVAGVNRLRLIVGDAGDGNKFDAGDWCEPTLKR
ncbi:MAG TPA: NPCBM/NEW2 domain-containing protein, partial [Humisphaera sp.]|nr:NPCBM/NEW2 domain-containing protein [Humisphaera sp.]